MFEIKMDEIVIDVSEISFAAQSEELQKAMKVVIAKHGKLAQQGKAPDGSGQTINRDPYRSRKENPGIRVGSRLHRGTIPTILTGDMMASRDVKSGSKEITSAFIGGKRGDSNAEKARKLDKLGYKIHFFSDSDMDFIQKRSADAIDAAKLVKVKKKT